uniref:Translation initiation factor-like protein n=1 Tax=Podoviridae sp. ctdDI2 TaxID=2826567 RepID=A0A8S5NR73_9CAUD|nr:MAG TPA: translation initiation factor-like protein [Podoviridae sp. ctdDI2]
MLAGELVKCQERCSLFSNTPGGARICANVIPAVKVGERQPHHTRMCQMGAYHCSALSVGDIRRGTVYGSGYNRAVQVQIPA